jgi:SNF2 family DNA or RNA helicase
VAEGGERGQEFGLAWPGRFFPYQVDGIKRLVSQPNVLLADEMGLGKTIQAIAAVRVLKSSGQINRALIVAPAGLILQWRRQFRDWAPELRLSTVVGSADDRRRAWQTAAEVYLVGYEALRADLWSRGQWAPAEQHYGVIIADEAQRLKNALTGLAQGLKRLRRDRSWALTGTPLENRLDDLLSILGFVAPGRFDPRQKAAGLRRVLGEIQLRRRRREVLSDLPPKFAAIVRLPLSGPQRATYDRAEQEGLVRLHALGRELRITHVLELILRLKQICNFCPETGSSSKLGDLRERLATVVANGEKALVFSQFVDEPFGANRIARELADLRPLLFTGRLDALSRSAAIAEFNRAADRRVLVLSLKAGGTGLNLTTASNVFHFDRWWNPAVEAQAEDRVHRIGQDRSVYVQAYVMADTVEERIHEILNEKQVLFTDVVDGLDTNGLRNLDLDALLRAVHPA